MISGLPIARDGLSLQGVCICTGDLIEVGHSSQTCVWAAHLPAFPPGAHLQAVPNVPCCRPQANTLTRQPRQNRHPSARPQHLVATVCSKGGTFRLLCCKSSVQGSHYYAHIYIHTRRNTSHLSTQCVACKMTARIQKRARGKSFAWPCYYTSVRASPGCWQSALKVQLLFAVLLTQIRCGSCDDSHLASAWHCHQDMSSHKADISFTKPVTCKLHCWSTGCIVDFLLVGLNLF